LNRPTIQSQQPSRRHATATLCIKRSLIPAVALLVFAALPLHGQDRHAVSKVPPVYPPLARQMHITGVVKVLATIDASGKVTKAESPSGNKILALSAIDCVKQWKFAPGDGITTVIIDVDFEI